MGIALIIRIHTDLDFGFLGFRPMACRAVLVKVKHHPLGTGHGIYLGFVLLPVTVSKQVSLFLNKAFTNNHHPLLLVLGWTEDMPQHMSN